MPKVFGLTWAYEAFEDDLSFFTKRMFGGMAVYVHDKMMMMLAEDPGNKEYRGEKYPYDIWNGVLFPTDREHHESLIKQWPLLVKHPVLAKWVYAEMSHPDFESAVLDMAECIRKNDPRFGIIPSSKKRKKKAGKKTVKKKTVQKKVVKKISAKKKAKKKTKKKK